MGIAKQGRHRHGPPAVAFRQRNPADSVGAPDQVLRVAERRPFEVVPRTPQPARQLRERLDDSVDAGEAGRAIGGLIRSCNCRVRLRHAQWVRPPPAAADSRSRMAIASMHPSMQDAIHGTAHGCVASTISSISNSRYWASISSQICYLPRIGREFALSDELRGSARGRAVLDFRRRRFGMSLLPFRQQRPGAS